jgi:exonuclease V gamma subunit
LGELTWEVQEREIAALVASLSPLRQQVAKKLIDVTSIPGLHLEGEVDWADTAGLDPWILYYRPSKLKDKPKYLLEAYIHTLAATVQLNQPVNCKILGLDFTTPKQVPGVPVAEAILRLTALVNGYSEGQRQPLCFAPSTSYAIAHALKNLESDQGAVLAGKTKWNKTGDDNAPDGEGLAPAATIAWRDQDPFDPTHSPAWLQWSRAAALPFYHWWEGSGPAAGAPKKTSKKKA